MCSYLEGEDRWLCTLLLQQGDRVEYCAASNSYTKAPEEFKEFFNQRRRWIPSTMANIADLISSWRSTRSVNENISIVYIAYQLTMFVVSVFGPGTIFMLMTGALQLALEKVWPTMTFTDSFFINLAPVVIFILLCFFAKPDTQIRFAYVLSFIYCVIQILVLIGILVPMFQVTPIYCNVNALFFLYTAGTFVLCGVLHPHELLTLAQGFVYYMAIPTMYMILMLYAICNLNVISWGTREAKTVKPKSDSISQREQSSGGLIGSLATRTSSWFGTNSTTNGCCSARCGCCPPIHLQVVINPQMSGSTVEPFHANLTINGEYSVDADNRHDLNAAIKPFTTSQSVMTADHNDESKRDQQTPQSTPVTDQTSVSVDRTSWKNDPFLTECNVEQLEESETVFFKGLIGEYLEPESKAGADKEEAQKERDRVQEELHGMRNRYAFGFLTINIAFVITLLVLQSYTADVFGVNWLPELCNQNSNFSSYDISSGSKIEPVGLAFLFLFGTILLIQTAGMIAHRLGTFIHIIAMISITFFQQSKVLKPDDEAHPNKEVVDSDENDDGVGGDERSAIYSSRRYRVLSTIRRRTSRNFPVDFTGDGDPGTSPPKKRPHRTKPKPPLQDIFYANAAYVDCGGGELETKQTNPHSAEAHGMQGTKACENVYVV